MADTATEPTMLDKLREERDKIHEDTETYLNACAEQKRGLNTAEEASFAESRKRLDLLNWRIDALEDKERRDLIAQDAASKLPAEPAKRTDRTHVDGEPRAYARGNGQSYFRDLAAVTTGRGVDPAEARDRLNRHAQQIEKELEQREQRNADKAERELRQIDGSAYFEKRVNPNRTDGQGGYLVPPLWLMDEFLPYLRAGRPFANAVRNIPLPGGTDSINIPKLATGTTVAAQTADAGSVSSTDLTDTYVTGGVKTEAGQQDVALQLVEQSPLAIDDQVIFPDLIADLNMKIDRQCLYGTGSNGQVTGVDVMSDTGVIDVTYTDASPTGPEFYVPLAQSASQVASTRYMMPSHQFMHPRRWFWFVSQLDGSNRPLVVPAVGGPNNAMGVNATNGEAEGFVGWTSVGLPVWIDANIPTTKGGGTNQDAVYTVRANDLFLFEGSLRTRVLQEVLSGTLQVRFQVYEYFAFIPNRYPQAVARINGTGLVAPSGF